MQYYRLEHNNRRLPWLVGACTGVAERARGLLFRSGGFQSGQAVLIAPCRQIHTFGMRFPIDLLFCDEEWRVVDLLDRVAPWKVAGHRQARVTWEFPAGSIRLLGLRLGDRLCPG